jgi:hypothetical protein
MRMQSPITQNLPLNMVGSTVFGRYPKISTEQTYNMLISDDWLVPYAGYKVVARISPTGEGRGIFASTRLNHLILVVDDAVYTVSDNLGVTKIANIATISGDVTIAENNASQIGICDGLNIYIYDYSTGAFSTLTPTALKFTPGWISFQDTRFISVDKITGQWVLSEEGNGLNWTDPDGTDNAPYFGEFQTKPDKALAAVPMPSKGNMLLVFGSTVTEIWYDTGAQLFPYQKNTFSNFDYGCLNPATIAALENMVVWLGGNNQAGPTIMYSDGSSITQISTDGINFQLANLSNPKSSYAFLFRQDGHLIYQITFVEDNLSYAYDFNTQKFFTLCDPDMNHHIAKRVAFLDNKYYFVSIKDGNLYELNSQFTDADGEELVRIRICKPLRNAQQNYFVVNNLTFTIEQGIYSDIQRIDLSVSKDGGMSFSSYVSKTLNPLAKRKNRMNFWNLGAANDFVAQFRFWGNGRFVLTDGVVSTYQ